MREQPKVSVRHLAVGIAVVSVFIGLAFVAIGTSAGQFVDDSAILTARSADFGVDLTAVVVSAPVASAVAVLIVGLAGIALGRYAAVARALIVCVGANITTQMLKNDLIDRPHFSDSLVFSPNSFPSGHATLAFSVVAFLFIVVPRAAARVVGVPVVIWSGAVACGTVVIGWHRPSDVIGACLVVITWDQMTKAIRVPAAHRFRGRRRRRSRVFEPDAPDDRAGRPIEEVDTVEG